MDEHNPGIFRARQKPGGHVAELSRIENLVERQAEGLLRIAIKREAVQPDHVTRSNTAAHGSKPPGDSRPFAGKYFPSLSVCVHCLQAPDTWHLERFARSGALRLQRDPIVGHRHDTHVQGIRGVIGLEGTVK